MTRIIIAMMAPLRPAGFSGAFVGDSLVGVVAGMVLFDPVPGVVMFGFAVVSFVTGVVVTLDDGVVEFWVVTKL